MRARRLPRGLHLTELGFGGAQLGNLFRETTDDEAAGAVDAAWDAGIRYFDTAPHYGLGLSERRIGRALAGRPRDDYILSTKVGRLIVPSPGTAGRQDDQGFAVPAESARQWDLSRDGIRRSIDDSLGRLGLDDIDIAYLHDPDDQGIEAAEGAVAALAELRDEGVLGAIGVGMNQSAMPAELIRRGDLDVVMLAGRFTLLDQEGLDELLPLAEERGVGIVAAGVYNSGLLSRDRPAEDANFDYGPAPAELRERALRLAEVCERHGVHLPEAAIQYPLSHPAVVSVVVGVRTADQVRSSVERFEREIPDALWADLRESGLVRSAERRSA
jgi:D-threo-aldose 1-dehydrogenase